MKNVKSLENCPLNRKKYKNNKLLIRSWCCSPVVMVVLYFTRSGFEILPSDKISLGDIYPGMFMISGKISLVIIYPPTHSFPWNVATEYPFGYKWCVSKCYSMFSLTASIINVSLRKLSAWCGQAIPSRSGLERIRDPLWWHNFFHRTCKLWK